MEVADQEEKTKKGPWVFIAPVRNLRLTEATNFEFEVDKVSFVDAAKLPLRRKKYGLPVPVSKIGKGIKSIDEVLRGQPTVATLRLTGDVKALKQGFVNIVQDELSILSLSQLGWSRRRRNAFPALSDEQPIGRRSSLLLNSSDASWTQPNELVGRYGTLYLSAEWKRFQKEVFFFPLLEIISGRTKVAPNWKRDIRNAAILAGKSQSISDISQAFLWNMIALETLLTTVNDKYSEELPRRAEAFIGWSKDWQVDNFETRIKSLYKKRCVFVHTGNRSDITMGDLLFSDDLLLNVLTNITRHPSIFGSKEKIVTFSEKIQAEQILGIKGRVRPKTLRLYRPRYTTEDRGDT